MVDIDKAERVAIEAFVTRMHAHTVSLVRLDPETSQPVLLAEPPGKRPVASGVIVESPGRLVLACAGHTLADGVWALETDRIDWRNRQVLLVKLEPAAFISSDAAWVDLMTVLKSLPVDDRPKTLPVYRGPIGRPRKGVDYGFAAANRALLLKGYETADLIRDPSYEYGMRLVGTDADGRYVFKLRSEHRGDAYYGGASGAPIAAADGTIVALVSGGNEDENEIYGVPLEALVALLGSGS